MALGGMLPIVMGTNTTVTTTAVRLAVGAGDLANPQTQVVMNNGVGPIRCGPSGVTAQLGIPIAAGSTRDFQLEPGVELYAITTVTSTANPALASVTTFRV